MHELYSLMVPVDLRDRITLGFETKGIEIACTHADVPEDNSNLVWKAIEIFSARYREKKGDLPFNGVQVVLEKNIPVGAGLGGGSSNAAAILTALNRHLDHVFSVPQLMDMGLCLGADVPFFIHGGPAYASGVGEVLTPCRDLPHMYALICCPGVFSSTAQVFENFDNGLTLPPNYIMNTGSNVLPQGQKPEDWEGLHNDLEGPASRLYPVIGNTKQEMAVLLEQAVFMSGSGSSLFALFSGRGRAENGLNTLARAWSGSKKKVFLARVLHKDRRV
jgi:4-diphosphocytidyl-2-C-methyl-D-erythritol kinase